jgi:hypothetical protein
MLDIVHCLRYVCYTRRFGSWLYSRLQVFGCHDTDTFPLFSINSDGGRDRSRDLSNDRLVR